MRILFLDIDTLRPDHLGCYGYHRATSPHIDRLAAEGVRFDNCYVSDAPCLPSRAALYSGSFGIRNGAINHGGGAADVWINPASRDFRTLQDNFVVQLRKAGLHTVSVSPFGERHSAFWFYNGFNEMFNTGRGGSESAEEIMPVALDWLDRRGRGDNWFLHVNLWDPHTPYRAPKDVGNPFAAVPPPAWMTEKVRQATWNTYGPGCAQEPGGDFTFSRAYGKWADRMALQIDSLDAYKKWIDGYDTGIYYADLHVGRIIAKLEQLGIWDDTLVILSSDHGENQGELAVYGDHQTADHITNRVPLVIRHPKGIGGRGRADAALHYQFDAAATLLDLLNVKVPGSWDGVSFLAAFKNCRAAGRDHLVVSNCAWACQRSVRWAGLLMIKTFHSGFKNYPDIMLFDVAADPHELSNLASARPADAKAGEAMLDAWTAGALARSPRGIDPMRIVLDEGGPFHARYGSQDFEEYAQRLRATGRDAFADDLERRAHR